MPRSRHSSTWQTRGSGLGTRWAGEAAAGSAGWRGRAAAAVATAPAREKRGGGGGDAAARRSWAGAACCLRGSGAATKRAHACGAAAPHLLVHQLAGESVGGVVQHLLIGEGKEGRGGGRRRARLVRPARGPPLAQDNWPGRAATGASRGALGVKAATEGGGQARGGGRRGVRYGRGGRGGAASRRPTAPQRCRSGAALTHTAALAPYRSAAPGSRAAPVGVSDHPAAPGRGPWCSPES